MDKKKFSPDDAEIIHEKDEKINDNDLSEIAGGASAEERTCTCDCWIGNSNSGEADKDTTLI